MSYTQVNPKKNYQTTAWSSMKTYENSKALSVGYNINTRKKMYRDSHPVSREVLKFMFWKVLMAGWLQLWLATAPAEPRNFSQQS